MPNVQIDFDQILEDCLAAAKTNLVKGYKKVKPYAEHEFRQLAEDAVFLAQLKLTSQIDDLEFKHRLEVQKLAAANVLLAIEGIGLIAAQNTINAVIGIIGKAVQSAIGVVIPI